MGGPRGRCDRRGAPAARVVGEQQAPRPRPLRHHRTPGRLLAHMVSTRLVQCDPGQRVPASRTARRQQQQAPVSRTSPPGPGTPAAPPPAGQRRGPPSPCPASPVDLGRRPRPAAPPGIRHPAAPKRPVADTPLHGTQAAAPGKRHLAPTWTWPKPTARLCRSVGSTESGHPARQAGWTFPETAAPEAIATNSPAANVEVERPVTRGCRSADSRVPGHRRVRYRRSRGASQRPPLPMEPDHGQSVSSRARQYTRSATTITGRSQNCLRPGWIM